MKQRGNLIVIVLVIVGVVVLVYLMANSGPSAVTAPADSVVPSEQITDSQKITTTIDFPKGDSIIRAEQFSVGGVTYALELVSTVNSKGNKIVYQRLVRTVGGKREVVVADIDAVVPNLGKYALTKFVVDSPSRTVVFVAAVSDPSVPLGGLYKFDVGTGKFTKMFVSRFLPSNLNAEVNAPVFSSDKLRFLSLVDRENRKTEAKQLYVVDLTNDQARAIVFAKDGESFTENINAYGDPVGSYRWLSDTTMEYSLFRPADTMPRMSFITKSDFVNPAEK